jgi:hypothetical protein
MNIEIAKAKVANALTSAASDHVIAVTADIYDENQNKYQSVINAQVIQDIENLKENGGGGGGGTPSGDLSEYAKKTYVDDKVQKAKDYADEQIGNIDIPKLPELADVATSGSYNDLTNKPEIPDVSDLETKEVVAENLTEAKQYTDNKTKDLATKEEMESSLNTKQDKTAIVTATNSVSVDKRSEINVTGDVMISLESYVQDGYAHSYEIVLNVGDTAHSVAFPSNIKWVKNLDIVSNSRYYIIIEDNTAMWTAVTN